MIGSLYSLQARHLRAYNPLGKGTWIPIVARSLNTSARWRIHTLRLLLFLEFPIKAERYDGADYGELCTIHEALTAISPFHKPDEHGTETSTVHGLIRPGS